MSLPTFEDLARELESSQPQEPCDVRARVNCRRPAAAWTFWRCPVHGGLRFGACLDHLVESASVAFADPDHWIHVVDCNERLTYLGHAPIKP